MVDYGKQSFIIGSDRSGYRHLYEYDYNGMLKRQLTSGNYYVTAYYGYNPQTREYFFQTTQEGSTERNVAKAGKGGVIMLHPGKGWESAAFSSNMQYYVRTYSNVLTPPQYTLHSLKGKIANLEMNTDYAARYANAPKKEFISIPNADGEMMDAYVIKPSDFDASKKYPLVTYQYNGPESQEVQNRWRMDGVYYFASQGYIVACMDGRGTGYRSRKWSDCVYKHLGEYETKDQIAGARYFASLPYVDSERMACFGWSYGGYETLMAASADAAPFAAAVAIAPVSDWRFYDTVYTERYMLTPQQNETGYNSSSALRRATSLTCPLLVMYGTLDDNVHPANSLQYVSALQSAGILCDMFVFPNMNHSINGCNARAVVYGRMFEFFSDRLK